MNPTQQQALLEQSILNEIQRWDWSTAGGLLLKWIGLPFIVICFIYGFIHLGLPKVKRFFEYIKNEWRKA